MGHPLGQGLPSLDELLELAGNGRGVVALNGHGLLHAEVCMCEGKDWTFGSVQGVLEPLQGSSTCTSTCDPTITTHHIAQSA